MTGVFGNHQLGIPYQPVADLLANYRARDPARPRSSISTGIAYHFGELDRVTTDIGVDLKHHGLGKGSRVLLLSDENLKSC